MNRLLLFLLGFVLMACKSDANPRKELKSSTVLGQVSPAERTEAAALEEKKTSDPLELVEKSPNQSRAAKDLNAPKQGKEVKTVFGPKQEKYVHKDGQIDHDPAEDKKPPQQKELIVTKSSNDARIEEESGTHAQPDERVDSTVDGSGEGEVDHAVWDGLLSRFVSATGEVDYTNLKKERYLLNQYLDVLAKEVPDVSWKRADAMSYWINAYNAFTVDLILSNYPVSAITDLDNGNPWAVKRIVLSGNKYSLNQIEHDIIRPQFKDARVHFAVNCAAKSCPKLNNRAWTAENLEANLARLTQEFINSPSYNKIQKSKASLSKIFEWYKDDFGDLVAFINKYSAVKIADGATIEFMDYNWSLNGK